MAYGLKDTGEEFLVDYVFEESVTKPTSVDVGLYNDNTDSLTDSDDIGSINTEPGGASYARQSVSFGTGFSSVDNSNGNWETQMVDLTFDVSDSSQTVDGYFVVITFQSDDKGDGSATDHLFWTAPLPSSLDLSGLSSNYTITDGGLTAD